MELSQTTINGLERLQSVSVINDETFVQLLEVVCADLLRKNDSKNLARIYGSKPETMKSAYADLTGLLVEAARHRLEPESLATFLHSTAKLFGPRADKIFEFYAKYRDPLVAELSRLGGGLPSIVDVNWRLDYCVQSSTCFASSGCLYTVRLVTKEHGKMDHVQFTCTLQQLQDLLFKLKEAVRHVDKIANA